MSHHATLILPVCRCLRRMADPAMGEIALKNPSQFFPQGVEQRLGLLEVSGIKAFSEPAIDRREQRASLGARALALPQARQAQGGPEFEGFCLLLPGYVEGMLKTHLGVMLILTALRWMALGFA